MWVYVSFSFWGHLEGIGMLSVDTYSLRLKGAWLSKTLLEATAYADSAITLAEARG